MIALQESSRSWLFFQEINDIEWRRACLKPARSRSFFLMFELPKEHGECFWTREGCRWHETVKSPKILKKEEGLLSSKVIRKGVWAWVCAEGGRGALLPCSAVISCGLAWLIELSTDQWWSPLKTQHPRKGKGCVSLCSSGRWCQVSTEMAHVHPALPVPISLSLPKVLPGFNRAFPEHLNLFSFIFVAAVEAHLGYFPWNVGLSASYQGRKAGEGWRLLLHVACRGLFACCTEDEVCHHVLFRSHFSLQHCLFSSVAVLLWQCIFKKLIKIPFRRTAFRSRQLELEWPRGGHSASVASAAPHDLGQK